MKKTVIKDEKGRDLVRISPRGRMAIARYPDMDGRIKDYIAGLCTKLSNRDKKEIMDFLSYVGKNMNSVRRVKGKYDR